MSDLDLLATAATEKTQTVPASGTAGDTRGWGMAGNVD